MEQKTQRGVAGKTINYKFFPLHPCCFYTPEHIYFKIPSTRTTKDESIRSLNYRYQKKLLM